MKVREDAPHAQAMKTLLKLAEEANPLPKGTRVTNEARFYAEARRWVPFLVGHYLASVKAAKP